MTSGVARASGAAMTADAARAADTAEALDASLTRSELSAPDIQDREKFDRMLEFGHALPRVRTTSEQHLRGRELSRERVLAAAVRLIDLGFFRSGSDEYAADNGAFGLATIRREHVTCHKDEITFEYVGKSGKRHLQAVADDLASPVVRSLKRRRSFPDCDDLLVSAVGGDGTTSRPGTSTTICGTYRRRLHRQDFRTRHATVLAAVGLAVSQAAESPTARKRAITRVVQEVAECLGNTPAVARTSYIDARVIARYEDGITIASSLADLGKGREFGDVATKGHAEKALLRLLSSGRARV